MHVSAQLHQSLKFIDLNHISYTYFDSFYLQILHAHLKLIIQKISKYKIIQFIRVLPGTLMSPMSRWCMVCIIPLWIVWKHKHLYIFFMFALKICNVQFSLNTLKFANPCAVGRYINVNSCFGYIYYVRLNKTFKLTLSIWYELMKNNC